ncbi:MAG: hypothetical protein IPL01_22995 [Acidobacteria bacterium]|nr:hypothetical protein [Acidobacteriota bacterium]
MLYVRSSIIKNAVPEVNFPTQGVYRGYKTMLAASCWPKGLRISNSTGCTRTINYLEPDDGPGTERWFIAESSILTGTRVYECSLGGSTKIFTRHERDSKYLDSGLRHF